MALRTYILSRITRVRRSILARLVAVFALLATVLVALVGVVGTGALGALDEMNRAEQSFRQLETARGIEAAFNRYLLREITRRLSLEPDTGESAEARLLRQALFDYQRAIQAEIAAADTDSGRAAERAEMVRAKALSDLFEAIETDSTFDRLNPDTLQADDAANAFIDYIAAGRDEIFRSVLLEVVIDERTEIEAVVDALDALRVRVIGWGAVLGALFAVIALVAVVQFRRGLMRPIRGLSAAADAFGGGARTARAPGDLPGEFASLARGFNRMAAQLSAQQDALEEQVAARTADLAAANDALTQIDVARRRFFANVSHELRTPVTVLLGEAGLALRGRIEDAEVREAMERINASGGFLRRRLDDLMRLARSEDGQLALDRTPTAFPAPVAEAVDLARGYAASCEVSLAWEAGVEAEISADAEALRQAALALIDNAVKFSPPGGDVTVRAGLAGTAAWFSVADRGPGFAGEDPGALLDRYAQESAGRAAGGSGLGLAIAHWIADQHGGTLSAENRPDGGAIVRMEIPL